MTPHEKAVEAAEQAGDATLYDDNTNWSALYTAAITAYLASMEAQGWVMVEQPVGTASDTRVAELEAEVERLRALVPAQPQPTDDGWIPWDGNGYPLIWPGSLIKVKTRGGAEHGEEPALLFHWPHIGADGDIIAYRVVQP